MVMVFQKQLHSQTKGKTISKQTIALLKKASDAYAAVFPPTAHFERAIFVSWYCSVGDCTFCYMSTQKALIKHPQTAKRTRESILAEAYLCKRLGWEIEFLSAGYSGVSSQELEFLLKTITALYGKKLWLNTGFIPLSLLRVYQPYLEGVSGSIETLNPVLHNQVCPSKPIAPYRKLYEYAQQLGLKKAITLIIGLGETKEDFAVTKEFIEQYDIDRITVYALRPIKGTAFSSPPPLDYYLWWIASLRLAFKQKTLIAGIWHNDLTTLAPLFDAGANAV
ncbi:MAG: radical SAM protein, partial [Candidatus Woesearchaeota archaeon]